MKKLKIIIGAALLMAGFASCSKDSKTPDPNNTTAVPLVKQVVLTLPYITATTNYTYDDNKRLASVGAASHLITYRAGGFEIAYSTADGTRQITDVNLDNGRVNTVLSYASEIDRYNSTFNYDSKGRLIKIHQTRTGNGTVIGTWDYTYTWDDNDNLIAAGIPDNQGGSIKQTYSGFSAESVNTLSGKNFGFDYFGAAAFPSNYTPNHSGGAGSIFPGVYAGKLLPSVISSSFGVTNVIYHKNAQGNIDRIENVNAKDATDTGVFDIAYQ